MAIRPRAPRPLFLQTLRRGWPIIVVVGLLALLWFPFDWLSVVWPAFGEPFRLVFRSARDHLVGHTIFFFLVGGLTLLALPWLRRRPGRYLAGLVAAALVQETIQAVFRGQAPTFSDRNAFTGDALGGLGALALWGVIWLAGRIRRR